VFQELLADHEEAIRRSFREEMPEDQHIPADLYYTEEGNEVSLCRATRWDRVGGQQEGIEPWWVMLQINTFEVVEGDEPEEEDD
jgi:hypothetical protein